MVLGKGENKMKAKFKFVSKVSVILFLVLLGVIVLYTVVTKEQEVVLPNVLGIIWLISGAVALLCVAAAFVLDGITAWKKDKVSYCLGLVGTIGVLWLIMIAVEYFINNNGLQIVHGLGRAAAIVCGVRAGNYIFQKS